MPSTISFTRMRVERDVVAHAQDIRQSRRHFDTLKRTCRQSGGDANQPQFHGKLFDTALFEPNYRNEMSPGRTEQTSRATA